MKRIFLKFISAAVLLSIFMMNACIGAEPPETDVNIIPIEPGETVELSNESSEWLYRPSALGVEPIQYENGSFYFEGASYSILEYSIENKTLSLLCSNPRCDHRAKNSPCRMGMHVRDTYYRVMGENVYYTVFPATFYSYNMETGNGEPITEALDSFNSNIFTGCNYLYRNVGRGYIRTRYSDLKTEKVFEASDYTICAEMSGLLYVYDKVTECVYTCPESDPSELTLFWKGVWSQVWTGENTIAFQARNDEGEYCYYCVKFDGTVLSETELIGEAGWVSFCDGENLYYILRKNTELYLSDGSSPNSEPLAGHARELYKTNVNTGETSIAFVFDGDYSALYVPIGSSFYVTGNTMILSGLKGYVREKDSDGERKSQSINLGIGNGIIMIDMTNGDITCVGDTGVSAHGVDTVITKLEMRIGKETD